MKSKRYIPEKDAYSDKAARRIAGAILKVQYALSRRLGAAVNTRSRRGQKLLLLAFVLAGGILCSLPLLQLAGGAAPDAPYLLPHNPYRDSARLVPFSATDTALHITNNKNRER